MHTCYVSITQMHSLPLLSLQAHVLVLVLPVIHLVLLAAVDKASTARTT